MQTATPRIWNQFHVSISYVENHYTTNASKIFHANICLQNFLSAILRKKKSGVKQGRNFCLSFWDEELNTMVVVMITKLLHEFVIPYKLREISCQTLCPVGLGCSIYRLHLCRGVRPLLRTSIQDKTLNHLMVIFGGMQSTPSLPLLPGLLWLRVVVPDRVLSMDQIELFNV